MDHLCMRLGVFDERAIRAHLAHFGVAHGDVTARYGAEGNGPSIYVQDPEGRTVEPRGPPL